MFEVARLPSKLPTASKASHHGNMGSIALLSPFGLPQPVRAPGIPMGHYDSMETFYMDIHLWKRLGIIEAPIVWADAEIGKGKTSLAIVAALNAALLAVEENRKFKIMYEITRRNVGVAELSSLTRELGATVVDMSTYGLNIFDTSFGLTPGELLDVVLECFNYIENVDATTLEVTVFMAALREFLKRCNDPGYSKRASNRQFERCIAVLELDDVKEAIASSDEFEFDTLDEEEDQDEDKKQLQEAVNYLPNEVLAAADIELDEAEFMAARQRCLLAINRLRKGEYGRVFSGRNGFTQLFDQSALGIDLTSLNDATIGLVQTLLWKFKRSAANSDNEERRRRFVFDWEIHDENRESWLHAPYRREVPRYLKRIRAVNCVMWFNIHRIPGDFETLPEDARIAALNAVREGAVFFHGYHEETNSKATCSYFGYGKKVEAKMNRLRKGQFILRVGPSKPQVVTIVLSKAQRVQTFSEDASERKTRVTPALVALSEL